MDIERLRRVDPDFKKGKVDLSFSRTEILHIFMAVTVLGIAFSIIMVRGGLKLDEDTTLSIIKIFSISLILVTCSFLIHELGHKYMAQAYGAWSEFRAYPLGLLMSLMFSASGLLFAAPGAVYIQGRITMEQNGKISLAGPAVNIIFSAIAIIAMLMTTGLSSWILFQLAWINAFLGLFNMIPIPPLDGSKILAWSLPVYVIVAVVGAAEIAFLWIC